MAKFVIHLVVPAENGPIVTEAAGSTFKLSTGGRFAIYCNPAQKLDGMAHRGSDCPWAATCPACIAKAKAAGMDMTHPNQIDPETGEPLAADCCG